MVSAIAGARCRESRLLAAAPRAVQFFDVTDRRNNLVQTRAVLPYRDDRLAGNLLLVESLLDEAAPTLALSLSIVG